VTPEQKVAFLKEAGVWDVIGYPTCIDKLFELVAAHEREKQAEQEPVAWKPIETAPRHGRILVTGTDIGTCVASAGWNNDTPDDIRWEVVNDIVVHPTHWMPLPTWIQPFNAVGCYYGAADHIGHVVRLDVELPIGTTLYASNSSVKDMSDNAIAKPICTGAVGHFIHNEGQQFVQRLTGKFFKGKK
jgi:hypothetical protein